MRSRSGASAPGHSWIVSETFLAVDAVCALPWHHWFAENGAISALDVAEENLIAGGAGAFQQSVEAAFAEAGVTPRFLFMAQYTAARCGLVAEGLRLAIVDPVSARELPNLPIVLRLFRPTDHRLGRAAKQDRSFED